jgi:hypothetical protein
MSYFIKLTPVAQEDIKRLPKSAAIFVSQQLRLLGEYPTALSRKSYFPYPPNVQLYEFDRDLDAETREFFHVLFEYGADEATIFILGVARREATWWWGKHDEADE